MGKRPGRKRAGTRDLDSRLLTGPDQFQLTNRFSVVPRKLPFSTRSPPSVPSFGCGQLSRPRRPLMAAPPLLRLWQPLLEHTGYMKPVQTVSLRSVCCLASNVSHALFFWERRVSHQLTGKEKRAGTRHFDTDRRFRKHGGLHIYVYVHFYLYIHLQHLMGDSP